MATQRRMPVGADGIAASSPRLTRVDSFHIQPVAIQNNVLYNKSRAVFLTIPQLMDNPLFEGSSEDGKIVPSKGNFHSGNSQRSDQQRRRIPLSRLSLDESVGAKAARRMQSLSLSAREYESMWRTAQENATRDCQSVSALEDFEQFRQKLADLKQTKEDLESPQKKMLKSSGSFRSLNLGSASTRSLNLSPSRPTSPLKRLAVLASRKGVSALNPQRDFQRGGASLPPSMQKFALSLRAEGLFKLPNPASISPLSSDPGSPPHTEPPLPLPVPADTTASTPTVKAPKRRFFIRGCSIESCDGGLKDSAKIITRDPTNSPALGASLRLPKKDRGSGGQPRIVSAVSENELLVTPCSPRFPALNTPRAHRNAPQLKSKAFKKQQLERTQVTTCNPRPKDFRARCISIPRPMCYGSHILE